MAAWWQCGACNSECYAPCDCFARGCELELTIAGWEPNEAEDCGDIADLSFNGVHRITGLDVTSTQPYGYTCDFVYYFDTLVLTKEVGGGCICKEQPALYRIEGRLQCGGEGPDDFLVTLELDFYVPVYDEDEGCSPAPCAVEPKWEIWQSETIELYNGPLSGAPNCSSINPATIQIPWISVPGAETTCGLALDGNDATVSVRYVLCDPPPDGTDAKPCICCNETDIADLPDQMQVDIAGYENNGYSATPCVNCDAMDGTYVLDRISSACVWYGCFAVEPCTVEIPIDRIEMILGSSNSTGWWPAGPTNADGCAMTLWVFGNTIADCNDGQAAWPPSAGTINRYLLGVFHDNGDYYDTSGKCSAASGVPLDSIPDDYSDVSGAWQTGGNLPGFWCGFQNATVTITEI